MKLIYVSAGSILIYMSAKAIAWGRIVFGNVVYSNEYNLNGTETTINVVDGAKLMEIADEGLSAISMAVGLEAV